jgi:hypothetical protein
MQFVLIKQIFKKEKTVAILNIEYLMVLRLFLFKQ